ncbi:MAG: lysogenization regulator HflD [Gammaproteobacteria bacterium]|nr:lysogenization regulator HflD [Gammaproteobacteria bacterium]
MAIGFESHSRSHNARSRLGKPSCSIREISVWEEASLSSTSNDFSEWEYRNIALAVVTECALRVNQLAVDGTIPTDKLIACLNPVYKLEAGSVAELYPDISEFSQGIQALQESFDSAGLRKHANTVRYMLGMLVIQQHLNKQPEMQQLLGQRIGQLAAAESDDSQPAHEQALQADCAALARLYQDTISKLSYRIHVAGNPEHLRNPEVADRIRALLLAGIRSAVLWHQLGGRRWHLFVYKKRIHQCLAGVRRQLFSISRPDSDNVH